MLLFHDLHYRIIPPPPLQPDNLTNCFTTSFLWLKFVFHAGFSLDQNYFPSLQVKKKKSVLKMFSIQEYLTCGRGGGAVGRGCGAPASIFQKLNHTLVLKNAVLAVGWFLFSGDQALNDVLFLFAKLSQFLIWLQVNRKDPKTEKTWKPARNSRICSLHFQEGKPSPEFPDPCMNFSTTL